MSLFADALQDNLKVDKPASWIRPDRSPCVLDLKAVKEEITWVGSWLAQNSQTQMSLQTENHKCHAFKIHWHHLEA